MILNQLVEDVVESPRTFAKTFLGANDQALDGRIDQTGSVISLKSQCFAENNQILFRALWDATVNKDTFVLIIAEKEYRASIIGIKIRQLIENSDIQYGDVINKLTTTDFVFDNGSKISVKYTSEDGSILRGYAADTYIINNRSPSIDDELIEEVLIPQVTRSENVWLVNDPDQEDALTEHVLRNGAYIKKG